MSIKLNLGCGKNILPASDGWVNIDHVGGPGVDLVALLDNAIIHFHPGPGFPLTGPVVPKEGLPYENNSVDEFLMSHVLEHIKSPLTLMQELYRIAKPDAELLVRVPYGSSNDAYEDPTHVRQYFTGSFGYFSQPLYWRADYGYRGDWQAEQISLALNESRYGKVSKQQAMGEIMGYRNVVLEMVCRMRAVKPMREARKELQQAPEIFIVLVDDDMKFVRELV